MGHARARHGHAVDDALAHEVVPDAHSNSMPNTSGSLAGMLK
jgi:hypothetical protein